MAGCNVHARKWRKLSLPRAGCSTLPMPLVQPKVKKFEKVCGGGGWKYLHQFPCFLGFFFSSFSLLKEGSWGLRITRNSRREIQSTKGAPAVTTAAFAATAVLYPAPRRQKPATDLPPNVFAVFYGYVQSVSETILLSFYARLVEMSTSFFCFFVCVYFFFSGLYRANLHQSFILQSIRTFSIFQRLQFFFLIRLRIPHPPGQYLFIHSSFISFQVFVRDNKVLIS